MPVIIYYTTGQTLYVKFDDASNTAVDLTEGTSLNQQRYEASDSAIASAGLEAGTYTAVIMDGSAASPNANDQIIALVDEFIFDGSNEVSVDISEVVELLLQIQGTNFDTNTHSLVQVITNLLLIMGSGFSSTTDSLAKIAGTLGLGVEAPAPPSENTPVSTGVSVTEIFNVGTYQIPISYNINTGPSVTGIRPNKSGTLYLSPAKRVSIETSRLISSQVENYVNDNLVEIYRRTVQV